MPLMKYEGDPSESEALNDHDQFEDEPRSEFGDDDPREQPRRDKKKNKNNKKNNKKDKKKNRNSDPDDEEDDDEEPRHKHSTADLDSTGKCKKYCWILLMFLIMFLIMFAIQKLLEHFFFGKESDNAAMEYKRNPNETFPLTKEQVDSACSRGSFAIDSGERCANACLPVYYDCCDPFDELDLYNYSVPTSDEPTEVPTDAFNDTEGPTTYEVLTSTWNASAEGNKTDFGATLFPEDERLPGTPDLPNITVSPAAEKTLFPDKDVFGEGTDEPSGLRGRNLQDGEEAPQTLAPIWWLDHIDKINGVYEKKECAFDAQLDGCMRYTKCQAITGQAPPAPATLPDMCSQAVLATDPTACLELCFEHAKCCFAMDSTNCVAEKFDLCMDYAPCQNLRDGTNLPTASRSLEQQCFLGTQPCLDECEIAECCGKESSLCYRNNFIPCLTYAPCNNVTRTHVSVPEQFNFVPAPPHELIWACNAHRDKILHATPKSCSDYCSEASCCWGMNPGKNCFHKDPLGCTAWEAQCQVLMNQ